jgi:acetylornithine/succinyldiaminopimelate/putrescine aminotransferase
VNRPYLPDGIAMAKSLGGGFPIGAFWVREKYADLLSPGTHATTFGGTPLGCAVALKILEVIERDRLGENVTGVGEFLIGELKALQKEFPNLIREVRGFGLMIGVELNPAAPGFPQSEKTPAIQAVERLHAAGLLTVPAGIAVIRLLPALNLAQAEAKAGLGAIGRVLKDLNENK